MAALVDGAADPSASLGTGLAQVLAGLSPLVPVGFFPWALCLTINWRENDGFTIAVWWLAFAASGGVAVAVASSLLRQFTRSR